MSLNKVQNGGFADSTHWTAGSGWTIGSSKATWTQSSGTGTLKQFINLIDGATYSVVFTMTITNTPTVTVSLGGGTGTDETTAATHTNSVVAGADGYLLFTPSGSAGDVATVDTVTVTYVSGGGLDRIRRFAQNLLGRIKWIFE